MNKKIAQCSTNGFELRKTYFPCKFTSVKYVSDTNFSALSRVVLLCFKVYFGKDIIRLVTETICAKIKKTSYVS